MSESATDSSIAQPASVTAHPLVAVASLSATASLLAGALASGAWGLVEQHQRSTAFWTLFRLEEPLAAVGTAGLLAAGLLAAGLYRARGRSAPLLAAIEIVGRRPWSVAAAFAVAAAAGAWVVYRAYPLCMDEYALWFQARAFAAGELTGKVPPELLPRVVPTFQAGWFLEAARDGRLISAYWPGFALLLTPFTLLGIPWLLNPLIGAASLVVLWHLSRKLLPPQACGWVILLTVASPVFLVDAISFYSMSAHLLFSLSFAALLVGEPSASRTALAGAVGSFALVLHNPVPHALFALPWIVRIVRRPRERHLLALLAGYLPLTLLLGGGWLAMRAAVESASPAARAPVPITALLVSLYRVAFAFPEIPQMVARLAGLTKLVLWASPGLVPLACIAVLPLWRRRRPEEEWLRLLSASAALTLAAYLFVPHDQGHGWGYRYFHAAWGVLPLLAVSALLEPEPAMARLRSAMLIAALGSLLLLVPLRLLQVQSFVDAQLAQIPAAPPSARQVVFVRPDRGFYSQDLVQNDPFLRGPRLIFFSKGEAADAELVRRFGSRPRLAARNDVAAVWVVE